MASITLTAKEKLIHDQGLVSVLKQLHDELNAAVFAAEILERLVARNAERAAEEQRGIIHWLRPDYQTRNAERGVRSGQKSLALPEGKPKVRKTPRSALRTPKLNWPKTLAECVKAVESALPAAAGPTAPAELAKQFKCARAAAVLETLQTLVTLGHARQHGGRFDQ